MIIILDFDETIFDTEKFREEFIILSAPYPTSFKKDELKKFIFPDVWDFFEAAKGKHRIFLATFGDEIFQRAKVEASGVTEFFEEMIFTGGEMKGSALAKHFPDTGESTIFVDDDPYQLASVQDLAPHIQTVQIVRDGGGQDVAQHTISSMAELKSILNN